MPVSCKKGCFNCCLRPEINVNELEIMGISWFIHERLDSEIKSILRRQINYHRESAKCPFLINSICSIYPMRPITCRMFYVFNSTCKTNEDVSITRPNDIWTHSIEVGKMASNHMLTYFGFTTSKEKQTAFNDGYIYKKSKLMYTIHLESIFETES